MRNEAGHKHEIDFTVAEDLIGNVHMTALGIADRRLHGTSPVMDGEVLPKAGQVMQRMVDPGAACPKVKLAFSAPMLQNNGLFYFMRSATVDTEDKRLFVRPVEQTVRAYHMAESHLKLVTPATFYERLRLDAQCRRSRQGERPTLSAPAYAAH